MTDSRKKYRCDRLVYYERYDDVYKAKRRELQLKGWRREKKIALIEKMNPHGKTWQKTGDGKFFSLGNFSKRRKNRTTLARTSDLG